MPPHVLVPLDGSEQATAGLEYSLASFPDAAITLLYVVDPNRDHYAGVGDAEPPVKRARAAAERILSAAKSRAEEVGVEANTTIRTGSPHTEILECLVEHEADHVVMGSHGESPITRPFLGHVSEAVVRRAPVTTTVVSEPPATLRERDLPGHVVVPTDGSEQAEAALEYVLAEFPDAEVTALHVVDLPFESSHDEVDGTYLEAIRDDFDERAEAVLESAATIAADHGASLETVRNYGEPTTEIVEYALEADADQLLMGSHGRSLAARLVVGTVAETVARRSPLAVTLVRGRPHDA